MIESDISVGTPFVVSQFAWASGTTFTLTPPTLTPLSSLPSELVKPPLVGRVEAKIINQLLQAFFVLYLCMVKRDLHLSFAVLVLLFERP